MNLLSGLLQVTTSRLPVYCMGMTELTELIQDLLSTVYKLLSLECSVYILLLCHDILQIFFQLFSLYSYVKLTSLCDHVTIIPVVVLM